MTTTIAFIGLGNMGGPMAVNLHKAGFKVTAVDLSADARARVAAEGVSVAATTSDALVGAQVVISMLPASRHVEGLYLGDGAANAGLLASLPAGTRIIDCSTIAPASARKVAAAAQARGLSMIDAPVSGGTAGAAPSWWVVQQTVLPLLSRYYRPWVRTYSMPAIAVPVRSPKSATTCCWPST